jgi:hypothetical protein
MRNGDYVKIRRIGGPDYREFFGNLTSRGDWGLRFTLSDGSELVIEDWEWNDYSIETLDFAGNWMPV